MSLYTEYSHTRDSLVMENLIPEVAIRPSNTKLSVQSRLLLFQASLSFYSMFSFDISGIRLDQTQLVGGFDFPNGTFVFNPWVNEATGIIEIGENKIGLQDMFEKSLQNPYTRHESQYRELMNRLYTVLALDGLGGRLSDFPAWCSEGDDGWVTSDISICGGSADSNSREDSPYIRRTGIITPGFSGLPKNSGFSRASLRQFFVINDNVMIPCVGYLNQDNKIVAVASDAAFDRKQIKQMNWNTSGFTFRAADLPPRFAYAEAVEVPVCVSCE